MALNTVSSDRLSTNVKNTNFTEAEKQDLTDDIKPLLGSSGGGNKNLIVNGAMQVAQRGTSSTSTGYHTVDRFATISSGLDEATTKSQADISSGTTPYTLGFRKSLKIQNGNQTSGAGAADYISIRYRIEAQDVAQSGWNYTSASSFITLSFWVKSSVAQNFYGRLMTNDGSVYSYPFETGSLTADTWTKITKTIPGNSNLQFDNNNGIGLQLHITQFWGTNYTDNGVTLNQWGAYNGNQRVPNYTTTWFTTNDATFELTGVQLEVGNVATEFDHKSFSDDLRKCQRYYNESYTYGTAAGTATTVGAYVFSLPGSQNYASVPSVRFPVPMRAAPSVTSYSTHNANTTGKMSADSTDKSVSIHYISDKGCFPFVNDSSSGISVNVFLRFQYTAVAEL